VVGAKACTDKEERAKRDTALAKDVEIAMIFNQTVVQIDQPNTFIVRTFLTDDDDGWWFHGIFFVVPSCMRGRRRE
jgi:hypothetical protein